MSDQTNYPRSWTNAPEFDPNANLMQLKGRDYMNVQARMLWFIRDQREMIMSGLAKVPYEITVVEVEHRDGYARYQATIIDVLGNKAVDYGSEQAKDFPDFAEKAATKSTGRALLKLGYGTAFADADLDEGERVVDSPMDRRAPSPKAQAPAPMAARQEPSLAPTPVPAESAPAAPTTPTTPTTSAANTPAANDTRLLKDVSPEDARALQEAISADKSFYKWVKEQKLSHIQGKLAERITIADYEWLMSALDDWFEEWNASQVTNPNQYLKDADLEQHALLLSQINEDPLLYNYIKREHYTHIDETISLAAQITVAGYHKLVNNLPAWREQYLLASAKPRVRPDDPTSPTIEAVEQFLAHVNALEAQGADLKTQAFAEVNAKVKKVEVGKPFTKHCTAAELEAAQTIVDRFSQQPTEGSKVTPIRRKA